MERYICIHGHFYQPPRENPWLEEIELQDGAYPYHDWNEKINAECYEPNTMSCILDDEGWTKKISNNYAKISFNFGPTLLSWLAAKQPAVYRAVIAADVQSRSSYGGHGSAMAQAYNHAILPLMNRRDKITQVRWGIRDFEHRFGRLPEGMWLPETAVDLETLDILAREGIRFTVLSPSQARRVRPAGESYWEDVGHGGIDPRRVYRVSLPGAGNKIAVFFYDGGIAQAVAFEQLLRDGGCFARRLLAGFTDDAGPQLVSVATDGETYGHHHRHGDMALAFALDYLESHHLARLTNYAQFLAEHPPAHEVEIRENSSWSCGHGVERWRGDCGCNSGLHPDWHQAWRAPLREALDWLRDAAAERYVTLAARYVRDPWEARDAYIGVILNRSGESRRKFLAGHAVRVLKIRERITLWKLLELQRHALLMYTSCGWFFDDISGIETVQVLKYAGRVIQLAAELFEENLEPRFLALLARARSNVPRYGDGARIYEEQVRPAMVDLARLGAHYAVCSLFDTVEEDSRLYCYRVHREEKVDRLAGATRMTAGRAVITSGITGESAVLAYGALHLGSPNVHAGAGPYREESHREMVRDLTAAFDAADYVGFIRCLDRHFPGATFSLKQLFRDRQRLILNRVLEATLCGVAGDYRRIYEELAPLMHFLKDLNIPQPRLLASAAEVIINTNLRLAFLEDPPDINRINALMEEAAVTKVPLDGAVLAYVFSRTLTRMSERLLADPNDRSLLADLNQAVGQARSLPFEVDLRKVRNIYYRLLQTVYPGWWKKAAQGEKGSRLQVALFEALGDKLRVRRDTGRGQRADNHDDYDA